LPTIFAQSLSRRGVEVRHRQGNTKM
jgi:hypothetical protein